MSNKKKTSSKKEKKPTVQDEVESLQITFYEIESWIEKTTPVLNRMTKELENASEHFEKRRKESPALLVTADREKKRLEQQLRQLQSLQQTEAKMQWSLSFQPGNMLRIDTNITSIEQLIDALQKIRLESEGSSAVLEEDVTTEMHSPSTHHSVEYWFNALGRRPKISLEGYKHDHMNLTGLTKDISPPVLDYIGQVFWDCLHPKFSSDWASFYDRSGEHKRNQVCIDSGLAMVFIHVMRHHKDLCQNAQEIACFYYDRAREELMEFFDEPPEVTTIEALLNLSMFCMLCKQYSQARNQIGLSLRMMLELGMNKKSRLPTHDLLLRKKYLKLFLVLYYNDVMNSVYSGAPYLIDDTDCDIDFYEMIALNQQLMPDPASPDLQKTIVKESYFAHLLELFKINKQTQKMIERGVSLKHLLLQEDLLKAWWARLPPHFQQQSVHQKSGLITMDAQALQSQASLLLLLQYETQWILLHKAHHSQDELRSRQICTASADRIVAASEVITDNYGWCVCQQFLSCIYQASTIYCNNIHDELSKTKSKQMIERIIRMLKAGSLSYEGLPDDLTECLCEFLTEHNMHNDMECVLKHT